MPQNPAPLSAFLFDLDGTLIDSIDLILRSYRHTMRTHRGQDPGDEVWMSGLGTPLWVQFRQFTQDPAEIDAMVATYREYNLAHHDDLVRPYAGVVDAVRALERRGKTLALVTSKLRSGALRGLRLAGLEDAFTVVNGAGLNVQADDTPTKNGWGRLGLRWKNHAATRTFWLGASGGVGDMIDTGDDPLDPSDDFRLVFNRWGVDTEWDSPLAFISAEYVSGHEVDKSTGETDEPVGWYVNLVGKTHWRVGPIFRLDDFDDDFHRYTLGAYYGLSSEKLRFMVNYEYRQRKDIVRGDDKLYFWTQIRF